METEMVSRRMPHLMIIMMIMVEVAIMMNIIYKVSEVELYR